MGPRIITGLTIARNYTYHNYDGIVSKCLHGRLFKDAKDVQTAWLDALKLVNTPYFFYIDDTDQLPPNYMAILTKAIDYDKAVVFTDELVNSNIRIKEPYSQFKHLNNPLLIHHLALCKTDIALQVASKLPRGQYWPEMMLYWEMIKIGGVSYIPEIGYIWNKTSHGLHKSWFTVLGISNSIAWCKANP